MPIGAAKVFGNLGAESIVEFDAGTSQLFRGSGRHGSVLTQFFPRFDRGRFRRHGLGVRCSMRVVRSVQSKYLAVCRAHARIAIEWIGGRRTFQVDDALTKRGGDLNRHLYGPCEDLMRAGDFGQERAVLETGAFHIWQSVVSHGVIEEARNMVCVDAELPCIHREEGQTRIVHQAIDAFADRLRGPAFADSLFQEFRIFGVENLIPVGQERSEGESHSWRVLWI